MVFKTMFYLYQPNIFWLSSSNTTVSSNTVVLSPNCKKYQTSKHGLKLIWESGNEGAEILLLPNIIAHQNALAIRMVITIHASMRAKVITRDDSHKQHITSSSFTDTKFAVSDTLYS